MARISMLIPDETLNLIDSVSENRTAFMIDAAVRAAKLRKRELEDAEISHICAENAERDRQITHAFDSALLDGLR